MKLEEQVCSLELAKRLKELGVKQNALWGWVKPAKTREWRIEPTGLYFNENHIIRQGWVGKHVYDAFTVGELGEMLPTEDKQDRLLEIRNHVGDVPADEPRT